MADKESYDIGYEDGLKEAEEIIKRLKEDNFKIRQTCVTLDTCRILSGAKIKNIRSESAAKSCFDYVYCTNCQHLKLDDEGWPYCPYEAECDIWDFEDSRWALERPMYKAKAEK